jgi:hypothetical protein
MKNDSLSKSLQTNESEFSSVCQSMNTEYHKLITAGQNVLKDMTLKIDNLHFRKSRGFWKLKAVRRKKVDGDVFFSSPLITQTISERLDRLFPHIFGVTYRGLAGRFIELSGDPESLWRNILSFSLINVADNVAYAFSADELNANFTTPATSTGSPDTSHISYHPLIQVDFFLFSCDWVAASIGRTLLTPLVWTPWVFFKFLLSLILLVSTRRIEGRKNLIKIHGIPSKLVFDSILGCFMFSQVTGGRPLIFLNH